MSSDDSFYMTSEKKLLEDTMIINNSLKYAIKIYPKVIENLDEDLHPYDPFTYIMINNETNGNLIASWEEFTSGVRKSIITPDMVSNLQKDGSITFHFKGPNYENDKKDVKDVDKDTQLKLDTYQSLKETALFTYMDIIIDACRHYKDVSCDTLEALKNKLLAEIKEYDDWVKSCSF